MKELENKENTEIGPQFGNIDELRADLLEKFSKGFSDFLHRRKIKVADVARMFNLSHPAVSSWKNGKGFPDFITLVRLFYAGMNLNEVFGNELKASIIKNSLSLDDLNFKDATIEDFEKMLNDSDFINSHPNIEREIDLPIFDLFRNVKDFKGVVGKKNNEKK
jgi:transcriptional regulator with XRE-family HTH domain